VCTFVLSINNVRIVRFSLEAALLRIFGDKLRIFLEKHFDIVSLAMAALGLIVLLIMKLAD
jgi:hypothetical protein